MVRIYGKKTNFFYLFCTVSLSSIVRTVVILILTVWKRCGLNYISSFKNFLSMTFTEFSEFNQVFPKMDHSVRICQNCICWIYHWISCWIKFFLKIWQRFHKVLAKLYLNIKFYGTVNDPLLILPGHEQDLGHENIVKTYLFYQVCKVHNIACLGDQSANARRPDTLVWDIST